MCVKMAEERFRKLEKLYVKEEAEASRKIWEEFYAPEMAPEEEEAETARIAEINAVRERNEEAILNLPNVVGLAVGYKVRAGKPTKELCLIVYVEKKVPENELPEKDIIPKEIEGIKTDVVETGRIEAL